jgi:hypothetical protein
LVLAADQTGGQVECERLPPQAGLAEEHQRRRQGIAARQLERSPEEGPHT